MVKRKCPRCNQEKTLNDFYNRRGKKGNSVYCKSCTCDQTIERQRKFKRKCIEYKGGKCESCGYDKYDGALEFHHKDPLKKDFSIANARLTSFSDKVKEELDKCLILCSNCHREEHARLKGNLPL
jgi:predicted HNH restriction endonuclease